MRRPPPFCSRASPPPNPPLRTDPCHLPSNGWPLPQSQGKIPRKLQLLDSPLLAAVLMRAMAKPPARIPVLHHDELLYLRHRTTLLACGPSEAGPAKSRAETS